MTDPTSSPPPGWYPDPAGSGLLRWWNGGSWTDDTRVMQQAPVAQGSVLRPVGDWMTETFRLLVQNFGQLFTLMLVLIVPATMVMAFAFWTALRGLVMTGGAFDTDEPPSFSGVTAMDVTLAVGGVVLFLFGLLAFNACTARHVLSARYGASVPWDVSLRGGLRRALPVFGWTTLLFVLWYVGSTLLVAVSLILGALGAGVVVIALIVGGIYLYVRFSMTSVTAAVGAPGWRSPLASYRVTGGNWAGVAGRILMLILVGLAASVGGSILSGPLLQLGGAEQTTDPDMIVFAEVLGDNVGLFILSWLALAVTGAVSAAMWSGGMSLVFQDLGGQVDDEIERRAADSETSPLT